MQIDLCVNNRDLLSQLLTFMVKEGDEIQYFKKDHLVVRAQLDKSDLQRENIVHISDNIRTATIQKRERPKKTTSDIYGFYDSYFSDVYNTLISSVSQDDITSMTTSFEITPEPNTEVTVDGQRTDERFDGNGHIDRTMLSRPITNNIQSRHTVQSERNVRGRRANNIYYDDYSDYYRRFENTDFDLQEEAARAINHTITPDQMSNLRNSVPSSIGVHAAPISTQPDFNLTFYNPDHPTEVIGTLRTQPASISASSIDAYNSLGHVNIIDPESLRTQLSRLRDMSFDSEL